MNTVDPLVGKTLLGRYLVVRRLAVGGMGVIYLARAGGAAGFAKPVVVKRILPDLDQTDVAQMFIREARILSKLRHPGIAQILEFAEEDGAYLMVLEYVHGYDLGRWRRYVTQTRGRFDFELAAHVITEVLDMLHHAHTLADANGEPLGIVHRDISPSNILIDTDGHVRLLDFGVARMAGEASVYKTEEFTVKGKMSYISPEQLAGAEPSPASDVYAAAVMLHELLVGTNEFRGREAVDTVARVLHHEPSKVADKRDDVPAQLDDVIARGLAKKPEERFDSAAGLAEALRTIRLLTTEEARASLLETIGADYAAMPEALDLEPLEVVEKSWRSPESLRPSTKATAAARPEPSTNPSGTSERPTSLETPASRSRSEIDAIPAPAKGGGATKLVIALALVGAAAAAGALAFSQPWASDRPPEQVFVVQSDRGGGATGGTDTELVDTELVDTEPVDTEGGGGEGAGGAEAHAPDNAPTGGDPSQTETGGATGGRAPVRAHGRSRTGGGSAPRPGEPLTATFARVGGPRIEACLREHAASVQGQPQIEMRFVLASSGEVRTAQVLPAAVGGTSLGRCMARVASAVRFAPQERDGVSFRIPITVERR